MKTTKGRPGSAFPRPARWMSAAVVLSALALGGGMFALTSHSNSREQQRLLVAEAQDARTTITVLMSSIETTMSSVGSVAAATNGAPNAVTSLASTDPSIDIFSSVVVLHGGSDGAITVSSQRGTPSASLSGSTGAVGHKLSYVFAHGGTEVVGLFGHGSHRRLALAEGAPWVPGGYVVYAEIPLPAGTTLASGFPSLQYVIYDGSSTHAPVLFATTKAAPVGGQQVRQLIDLDLTSPTVSSAHPPVGALLFVATATGPLSGQLPALLPWILGGISSSSASSSPSPSS